jgi:cytochrome c-L
MFKSKFKTSAILIALLSALSACNNDASAPGSGEAAKEATTSSSANTETIKLVTTQDGSPLEIDPAQFDTPAAKEFLATGKNTYIGNAEAIAQGKKLFGLYSCTQCHGPEAAGQVGPGLIGPTFKYPKVANNQGMFETIWHGTNGGMGGKGRGVMDPTDPTNGLSPDETLKVIAWIRSHGDITGNE